MKGGFPRHLPCFFFFFISLSPTQTLSLDHEAKKGRSCGKLEERKRDEERRETMEENESLCVAGKKAIAWRRFVRSTTGAHRVCFSEDCRREERKAPA